MLKRSSSDNQGLLCLDIGCSSIKACVFQEEDEALHIKGFSSIPLDRGNIEGGAIINLSQVITRVQEAVKEAENMARISPHDMVFGLTGEMVRGKTVELKKVRANPKKPIDSQELKSILYELQWQAYDQIRKEVSDDLSISEVDLKLMNASVVSVRLDDVLTHEPKGKNGNEITMEIFNCFAPRSHFGQLQTIAVELPYHDLRGVFLQSFCLCHSMVLKNALASAVTVDVGAGITDVGVALDGKMVGNRSFSCGGNTLTKRLSYELSTSFEEAESIKLSYSNDDLEKRSSAVIHEALEPDFDIWMSSLDFCLKELPMKRFPAEILLTGKSSLLKSFQEVLEHHDWPHHFPVDGAPTIRQLKCQDLIDDPEIEQELSAEFLPLLGVARTAADLLYHNPQIEDILQSIIADKGV